jgi:hypothetical protein
VNFQLDDSSPKDKNPAFLFTQKSGIFYAQLIQKTENRFFWVLFFENKN